MTAYIKLNPLQILLDTFNALSRSDQHVPITFKPHGEMPTPDSTPLNDDDSRPEGTGRVPAAGVTIFGPGGTVEIWLNASVPTEDLPAVLGEELAHVLAGPGAQHGPDFQEQYERLSVAFQENLERHAQQLPHPSFPSLPLQVGTVLQDLCASTDVHPNHLSQHDIDRQLRRQQTVQHIGNQARSLLSALGGRTTDGPSFGTTAPGAFLLDLMRAADNASQAIDLNIHESARYVTANNLVRERRNAIQRPSQLASAVATIPESGGVSTHERTAP
ncbi:hypothetical protein IHN63_06160 [Deinococcus sp. 6YEL10]|uniref:hypothetical protein n=1 Tax=Deinococcus sp. 6YEL10 TaxID=2745870 RepID=UPI001E3CAE6E|nr:hypothetical protein [Deinococcus sp. 6YEL10]MCD0160893.1 hypothetical protein [Deinococcus sp. 6YEL10]